MKLTALALTTLISYMVFGQAAKPAPRPAAAPIVSGPGHQRAPDQRKLIEFYEREMIESERKHNWEAIARRLTPDFLEIAADGKTYNQAQVAAHFPDVKLNQYSISEMEIRVIDANAAIIAYRVTVDATFKGQPAPGAARVSSVWVRHGGVWLMKFHQATPIPKQ